MSEFVRESRYYVAKFKDIETALSPSEILQLDSLMNKIDELRISEGKAPIDAVVVESHFPEFENVWNMLEQRCSKNDPVSVGDYVNATLLSESKLQQGIFLGRMNGTDFWILDSSEALHLCTGTSVRIPDSFLSESSLYFAKRWREKYLSSVEVA